ncbi:tetratricopeptide repeat protein [Capnocytophaga sp. ARDL2]|uniref:tetratricopeptide repeat protein n=1 Tax=Capnocytophaga sp. ARDL2 TaxID=3238809 RepID=UPI00355663A3
MNKKITLTFALISATLSAQNPMMDAEKVIAYGHFDVAKKYYKEELEKDASRGDFYYNLGRIHLAQNQKDSAELYFKEGLRAARNADINNLGIAFLSLENGKDKEALSKMKAYVLADKKINPEKILQSAKIYLESSKPNAERALEFALEAQTHDKKSVNAKLIEADAHLADGVKKIAELRYKQILRDQPKNVEAMLRLAKIHLIENNYPEAIALYKQAAEIEPGNPQIHKDAAFAYRDYAKFSNNNAYKKEAAASYKEFYKLVPESFDIDNQYGEFIVGLRDFNAVTELVENRWETRGDNFQMYRFAAVSAFENENSESSLLYSEKYFDVQDKVQKLTAVDYFYLGLGQVMQATKHKNTDEKLFSKGIENMKIGIQNDASLANYIYDKGLTLFQKNLYKEAYQVFDLGTKNENVEHFISNLYYKGACLFMTQDDPITSDPLSKANDCFEKVLSLAPNTHEAYIMNARTYDRKGDKFHQKSIDNYKKFIEAINSKDYGTTNEINEMKVEAYTNIGDFYRYSDRGRARANFQKVLSIDPNNQYAKKALNSL